MDVQSGSQSNLVNWIAVDNPKFKLDFGFGLSITFLLFNPIQKAELKKQKHIVSCSKKVGLSNCLYVTNEIKKHCY